MGSSNKTPMVEMQEKVDILSTSIEVINQKLANQLNPIAKSDPVLLKQVSMIDNKIGFLYNTLKKIEAGAITPQAQPDMNNQQMEQISSQMHDTTQTLQQKVDQTNMRINQITELQKQQLQVLTEQNKTINQHISDINDRITTLIDTNKQLMKTVAASIESDVELAKEETKKAEKKINQ